ncbi:sialoadhesin-like [Larimichthys crocea]|uniref:sialoadhesin-like n=1 Tax=Larimichthys crocea TaxID=215358 RepID=UPI000F5FC32F|nr:sialoadhesin-like [Larimichthys crocea]
MEVTALALFIRVSLLLVMQVQDSYSAQKACAGCPDVIPNRLQHFEYQSISFNCEVLDGSLAWAVKRKSSSGNITCGTNWGVPEGSGCRIRDVYVEDSGEYWCETKDGKTSKSVNIAVTAGSVILDIPVAPVTEGEAVTLSCRNKTPSNISASVYKNGILMKNVTTGNLIINSVSKCDEGLYKCISRAGESPESWLSVKEFHQEPIPLCSDQLPVLLYFLMRTVGTVVWVAMLLLVLRKRHKDR